MAQYPTVYNQNASDDDKDGGLGIDLGLDDEKDESPSGAQYADGELEAKSQTSEVATK
jgi:hypothetical protein